MTNQAGAERLVPLLSALAGLRRAYTPPRLAMEEFIATHIGEYGPIAVFILLMLSGIGIPVGEDLIIIPAGILVGNDSLPLWPTLLAAYVGVVCSDSLWFVICHRYGAHLLHMRWFKRIVHPRRLLEAKHQVEQRGVWVIVMARFIPGSRTPTITIAGLLHLPLWQFALATASCVLISAPVQLGLGYLIAVGIGTMRTADLVMWILAGIAILAAATFIIRWWKAHSPLKKRLPRARAAWLRRFRVQRIVRSMQRKRGSSAA